MNEALRREMRMLIVLVAAALFAILAMTAGPSVQKAEAAAGDVIIYHHTASVRADMVVCKNWTSTAWETTTYICGSSNDGSNQKRSILRGQSSSFWPDADGVWVPAGYDLYEGSYSLYPERSFGRWVKIPGFASGTATRSLRFTY